MPDSLASSILTGLAVEAMKALMKLVITRAFNEIKLMSWGFEDQLVKLRNKLVYIEAFLEDVGNEKHRQESRLVNHWLQDLKDAVYNAEEVIDDYALEMHRKKKLDIAIRLATKLSNLKTSPLGFHYEISRKVRKVLSMFDELDKKAHNIGLKQVQIASEALTSKSSFDSDLNANLHQVRKHASASAFEFVGRKFDEEKLLETLCNPGIYEGDLFIVAIVGIGGLGKTTLARRVYENEKVDKQFDKKKVWICVSENFNVEILLKEMVESLTSCKCDLSNTGAIINKLQEELKGKKFLLVLDDVWNNNLQLWDSLKNELRRIGDLVGSVILLTTRSIDVVEKAQAVYAHKLEGLSEDDGWALLKQKSFSGTLTIVSSFEDIGRRIVRKCKGVPLAIRAIRGILQSMKDPSKWEVVEGSELWDLPEDDENYIMPSLLLSFYHLPCLSLKQCFSYCSIFPKDELIEKSQVISLWLAQGFLHESERGNSTITMEDVGERYLQILLSNSFLQEERVDNISGGEIWSYRMHDLVHDLAVYISRKDLLVWKAKKAKPNGFAFRHCVLNFKESEVTHKTLAGITMQKLRTISFVGGKPRWDLLMSGRYMRTLILAKVGLEKVPPDIEQLRNLCYIDLSGNPIKVLPDSMCKLYRLQTLRLLGCNMLKKLPTEFHRLVNIRHVLTSSFVSAPRELQQLTFLQTLPRLKLSGGEGWTIDELGSLHELRGEICIAGLEHVISREEARKAGLRTKDRVSKLNLTWDRDRATRNANIDEDVLDGLEPHPSITLLKLEHFNGVWFPSWIMTMAVKQECSLTPAALSNLTVVELVSCKRCQWLPTLGQLPLLKLLSLKEMEDVKCIGDEFYVSDHVHVTTEVVVFAALRELRIDELTCLETWLPPPRTLEATAFPCLETLKVVNCPRLQSIPALQFRSLRNLEVRKLAGSQPLDIIKYNNSHLTWLTVSVMLEMTSLPKELSTCANLQYLKLTNCSKLTSIPSELKSLVSLEVWSCRALSFLAEDLFHGLSSLRKLSIWDCQELTVIPISLQECTQIEELRIENCPLIQDSVPDLSRLEGLVNLIVVRSGKLLMTSVLQSILHLHHLRKLELGGFTDKEYCEQIFTVTLSNQSLKHLTLKDFRNVKLFPPQLQLIFPSLKFLKIDSFRHLEALPDSIGNLSFLEELWLWKCDNLKFLPSVKVMRRLTRLQSLHIYVCPLLKKRCAENLNGPDSELAKISHISHIQIDCEDVQGLRS